MSNSPNVIVIPNTWGEFADRMSQLAMQITQLQERRRLEAVARGDAAVRGADEVGNETDPAVRARMATARTSEDPEHASLYENAARVGNPTRERAVGAQQEAVDHNLVGDILTRSLAAHAGLSGEQQAAHIARVQGNAIDYLVAQGVDPQIAERVAPTVGSLLPGMLVRSSTDRTAATSALRTAWADRAAAGYRSVDPRTGMLGAVSPDDIAGIADHFTDNMGMLDTARADDALRSLYAPAQVAAEQGQRTQMGAALSGDYARQRQPIYRDSTWQQGADGQVHRQDVMRAPTGEERSDILRGQAQVSALQQGIDASTKLYPTPERAGAAYQSLLQSRQQGLQLVLAINDATARGDAAALNSAQKTAATHMGGASGYMGMYSPGDTAGSYYIQPSKELMQGLIDTVDTQDKLLRIAARESGQPEPPPLPANWKGNTASTVRQHVEGTGKIPTANEANASYRVGLNSPAMAEVREYFPQTIQELQAMPEYNRRILQERMKTASPQAQTLYDLFLQMAVDAQYGTPTSTSRAPTASSAAPTAAVSSPKLKGLSEIGRGRGE